MAGITYAQVEAVADKLLLDGGDISIKIVRSILGTGSPNTIQKYLKDWRTGTAKPATANLTISQAVTNALIADMAACAAQARAGIEQKLIEAEADVAELASAGEMLESERDTLTQRVLELTSERDGIAGMSKQQEIEIVSLTERLQREQAAVRTTQVELAMEKVKSIDLQTRDVEQKGEIQAKTEALLIESKARVAAEQLAAVLGAKHESALALMSKADSRVDSLTKQLADCSSELQTVRSQLLTQQAQHSSLAREQQEAIAMAQRASAEAIQQVQRSSLAAQEAISAAKQAERQAAELRGRLDAMQELVKDGQAVA